MSFSSPGASSDSPVLSPGERRVLEEARSGSTAREIAGKLSLSEATVRTHLSHIYIKFGVRGRLELLGRLHRAGLMADEPLADARKEGTFAVSGQGDGAHGSIVMSVVRAVAGTTSAVVVVLAMMIVLSGVIGRQYGGPCTTDVCTNPAADTFVVIGFVLLAIGVSGFALTVRSSRRGRRKVE